MSLMQRPPRSSFGPLLRGLRSRAGLTLRDLATFLGVSVPYLSDVERGARGPLRPETIAQAARRLGGFQRDLQRAAERDVIARWRSGSR